MTTPHRPMSRAGAAAQLDPARRLAFKVLRAVSADDSYANLVLPQLIRQERKHGLDDRDAALATELTYGTLRLQGRYDAILASCIDRPWDQVDPAVRDVLRLGAHQLLATRIPVHAAVAATVDLARAEVGQGAASFVNAILRRVSAHDLDTWLEKVTQGLSDDEATAVRSAHPAWIVRALRDALVRNGRSPMELDDLLAADNRAPKVNLVALPGLSTPQEIGEADDRISPYAAIATTIPTLNPAVREGRARVQDAGSQAVTLAWTDAELVGPDGGRWLDMCAGPGGKAALSAAVLMQRRRAGEVPADACLDAVEVSAHRVELVRDSLKGVRGLAGAAPIVALHQGDSRRLSELQLEAGYDRVLLDAPCSGLGALRRRPESRWRRRPSDIAELGTLQRQLLTSALDVVRPGGVVAYVTCSPHPAETIAVVGDVLRQRDDVQALGSARQLWPHVDGTDAMYLSLLRRLGSAGR